MPSTLAQSLSPQKCVVVTAMASPSWSPGMPRVSAWSSGRGRPTTSGPRPGPGTTPVSRTSAPHQAQRGSASAHVHGSCLEGPTPSGTSTPYRAGSHPQRGRGRRHSVSLPMWACTPDILRTSPTSLTHIVEASSLRIALAHLALAPLRDRFASDVDDLEALPAPRMFRWTATSPLAHVLCALRHAQELPKVVRVHLRLQAMIHRFLHEHLVEDPWRQWLARRLRHLFDYLPAPGAFDFVIMRLRWRAADVPPFVILAFVRYMENGCPTTRRMTREPALCRFGCIVVGGGDLRRDVACGRLAMVARLGTCATDAVELSFSSCSGLGWCASPPKPFSALLTSAPGWQRWRSPRATRGHHRFPLAALPAVVSCGIS